MKYPIGIQSFEQIIEDDYVYLDKTALADEFWASSLTAEPVASIAPRSPLVLSSPNI